MFLPALISCCATAVAKSRANLITGLPAEPGQFRKALGRKAIRGPRYAQRGHTLPCAVEDGAGHAIHADLELTDRCRPAVSSDALDLSLQLARTGDGVLGERLEGASPKSGLPNASSTLPSDDAWSGVRLPTQSVAPMK